jgi:hypothetical protein
MVAVSEQQLRKAVGMLARRAGVSAVLLVTGRAEAAGTPVDPSRVAVVETLDDVARALGGDVLAAPVGRR